MLKNKYSPEQLQGLIISRNQWKPFPQNAAEWKKRLPDTVSTQLIMRGEAALKKDFYNIPASVTLEYITAGNRTDYETLSFTKRNLLWDLVLAEAVEGKGRFTDHIADGIWSICEETFWGINAHIGMQKAGAGLPDVTDPVVDLFAAETAADLAWADYLVGPELDGISKLIRPRIAYEVNKRIFVPIATTKYDWMGGGNPVAKLNNWAPWIMSNFLVTNLLIEQDPQKRLQGVNLAIKVTDQYINGLGTDGSCEEGPSYWSAAGGAVFDVLNLLYDSSGGRINIFDAPIIQKMGAYIYKTHIAGKYFVNVADAHPQSTIDGLMIYRFGKAVGDEQMKSFGHWAYQNYGNNLGSGTERFRNTRILYNLLALNDIGNYVQPYSDVKTAWLADVQLMVARLANGLFVSSHGGNNGESHNHNDVGDFTVYADGEPVIIDVGSGTYTSKTFSDKRYEIWYYTSAYHNLPTINYKEQKDGSRYEATNVVYQDNENADQLSMDIQKAYPDGTGLTRLNRTVTANKTGSIVVNDNLSMVLPISMLTQTFMTVCPTDITESGKITFSTAKGKKVQLSYDSSFWDIKKEQMPLTAAEDQALNELWQHRPIYRILLSAKKKLLSANISYLISKSIP